MRLVQGDGLSRDSYAQRYRARQDALRRHLSDETVQAIRSRLSHPTPPLPWPDARLMYRSRRMRSESPAEVLVHDFLRDLGIPYLDQVPVHNFILDIVVGGIVIEVDGRHHHQPEIRDADIHRDLRLAQLGFEVLRIPTSDLFSNATAALVRIFTGREKDL